MVTTQDGNKLLAKIEDLHNWELNPRDIKKEDLERGVWQLKRCKEITGEYLFEPLMITPDGTILGGNMRLKALKQLGVADVWVSIVNPKTEAEKLELALQANDRWGYYLEQMLADEIQEYGLKIDLEKYKVDLEEAITLLDVLNTVNPKEIVEDEAPEVDEVNEPRSKLGQRYKLGRHRLVCGDATKIEDVEKLMNGRKADMVFTDPPYGVEYESHIPPKERRFEVLKNDDVMLTDWIAPVLQYSSGWFLFCTSWKVLKDWLAIGEQVGKLTNMIIWNKGGGGLGDLTTTLSTDFEIILAYNRGSRIVGKRIGSVWEFNRDNPSSYQHPTQKPVALSAQAIQTMSSTGIVLDVFGGSGSTLMACEQLERTCYMMELDPKYVDVIRKRYAKFIGKEDTWEEVTKP